jgi:hypothetical protein
MKTNMYLWSYLAQIFLELNCFRQKLYRKIKTHFMFNILFPPGKSCRLWDVEKYTIARQATDDNMAHAYCMLNN